MFSIQGIRSSIIRALFPNKVRAAKLKSLFVLNNRLVHAESGQRFIVMESRLCEAVLVSDKTHDIVRICWLSDNGDIKYHIADEWNFAQPSGKPVSISDIRVIPDYWISAK